VNGAQIERYGNYGYSGTDDQEQVFLDGSHRSAPPTPTLPTKKTRLDPLSHDYELENRRRRVHRA